MGDDKRKRIKSDFYRQIKLKLNNQLKKQKDWKYMVASSLQILMQFVKETDHAPKQLKE